MENGILRKRMKLLVDYEKIFRKKENRNVPEIQGPGFLHGTFFLRLSDQNHDVTSEY